MAAPEEPKDGRVLRGHKAAVSDNGRFCVLTFTTADGKDHEIIVMFDQLADLVGRLEAASKESIARQTAALGGQDPRTFYPVKRRRLTTVGGGVTTDGVPMLALGIDGTLQLDVGLPVEQIPELIEWLRRLEANAKVHSKAKPS
jgi:hypothetical protein